jgi:hypothetical protein
MRDRGRSAQNVYDYLATRGRTTPSPGEEPVFGGHSLSGILTAVATLDFPNTAAQQSADLTITVPGAAVGDVVALGTPNGSVSVDSAFFAWVSAANQVTVRFVNFSAGAIDPASGSFRVIVFKVA